MLAQLSILAPGLLGASVARAARARNVASRIVIWTRRPETRAELAGQPWCDEASDDPGRAVTGATLVVIAAPVDQIPALTRQIAPCLRSDAIVTDVGSVKGEISRLCAAALGSSAHFVGSHPMAGSEKTGWEHGRANLFAGRTTFVTPLPETDPKIAERVASFWHALESEVATVAPDTHDEIVAHISHLPQVLASTLCAALQRQNPQWHTYSGGGLRDTTRIASSDPKLWRTILEQNRDEVLDALRHYQTELTSLQRALTDRNWADVQTILESGKNYRDQFRPTP